MGTSNSVIRPQSPENSRLCCKTHSLGTHSCHHHSTPLLEKLHWLPISERIKYKVACTCFSAINGSGPAYLSELLHVYTPSRTLRSSSDTRKANDTNTRLIAFAPALALDPTFGIHFHKTLDTAQLCHLSKTN